MIDNYDFPKISGRFREIRSYKNIKSLYLTINVQKYKTLGHGKKKGPISLAYSILRNEYFDCLWLVCVRRPIPACNYIVSERQSPEQEKNGPAGYWPQKIHPYIQLMQTYTKPRSTRKYPRCKQNRTNFAQNIGKNATSHNNRPRLKASHIAKLSQNGRIISTKITMECLNKRVFLPSQQIS